MLGSFLWRKKKTLGQTVAEYALIVALVAIASIAILTLFGNQLRELIRAETAQLAGSDETPQDVTGQRDQEVDKGVTKW